MRLIKYDGLSDKSVKAILGSSGGSSSNNSDVGSRRTIWGQDDTGDDIDGSMTVNGNISIKCIIPPSYEDDDSDDGEDEELEEGGGNLDVELKITSKDVEAKNIYATEHLYIPHPSTKAKTDIVELLKGYDTRITNNTTNIQNNADEIDKLKKSVSEINGDLEGLDLSEITNTINEMQNQMEILRYGNYVNPVILLSGKIRKYSYSSASSSFTFDGQKSDRITNLEISADGGTLYVTPTFMDGMSIYISAIHVTQEMSGDTADNSTVTKSLHSSDTSINGRSDGAHWFEAYYQDNKFKIREFHQRDQNNDSWGNDNWAGDGDGIRAINITVIGYIYKVV